MREFKKEIKLLNFTKPTGINVVKPKIVMNYQEKELYC